MNELNLHPPGAVPHDVPYSGCDADDDFAHAGQFYQRATSRAAVEAFYRETLVERGWHIRQAAPAHGEDRLDSAPPCLTKAVDGTTAYLSIWFERDFGSRSPDYAVEVNASHDGYADC